MIGYALRKLLLTVPTLLILAVIIFVIMRLVPGDPAVLLVGDLEDQALLEQVRQDLGLNEPLYVQFFAWLQNVLTGNLGVSLMTGQGVLEAMTDRFEVTAQLVLLAIGVAAIISIPAGMYAAWRQNSASDLTIVFILNVFLSVPSFWVALMLILLFGVTLGWLPTVGYVSITDNAVQGLMYLVMPVLSLVFLEVATMARMMRANTIEVMRQEYVTHARAKGLSEALVLSRHVFKNAFAPTMTLMGLILGSLLGGSAVIETVYTLPGLGRFLVDAIYARDYAVVQGVMIFVSLIYVVVNLTVDLLYPVFDPRVRLS